MTTVELRNEPIQDRSRARLESLRVATLDAVEAEGYDRFTTADVAVRAGCSIGTVYRYVPDRVALLDLIDPARYVFAEVRERRDELLAGIEAELDDYDGDLVGVLEDAVMVSKYRSRPSDAEWNRIHLLRAIAALQQKVVAIDTQRSAGA